MNINEFIKIVAGQFEDTDPSFFTPDTNFRDLEEWGSMSVLSLIAMADEEFGVELDPDDIRKTQTIKDLFDIIQSKK